MRKLIWVLHVLFVFMLCNCNNTPIKNIDESATTNMVGNDADEHGCRASAGYVWSELRKECIRTFEIGAPFFAFGNNTDSSLAAYIVLNNDKSKGELYMPKNKSAIELYKVENKKNDFGEVVFENDAAEIEIVDCDTNTFIVIKNRLKYELKLDVNMSR